PCGLVAHGCVPFGTVAERQVQSTGTPVPLPLATVWPARSATTTVQARADESRAWNRTGPPIKPATLGAYSFGRPVAATRLAIPGSSAYAAEPGHSLGPVSRWPEIARSVTSFPARNLALPPDV